MPTQSVRHFRDLEVWRQAMDLVESIYRLTAIFPKSELYGLTAQLRRAAVSVPSNIAEGHTRAGTNEFLHFVSVARASLAEVETQLEIANRLDYIDAAAFRSALSSLTTLSRKLHSLRASLLRRV